MKNPARIGAGGRGESGLDAFPETRLTELAEVLDVNGDALFLNVLAQRLPDVWKIFDKNAGSGLPIRRAVDLTPKPHSKPKKRPFRRTLNCYFITAHRFQRS
jgi:hypothetical protein